MVVVVDANRTKGQELRETLATLERASAPVLGAILNKLTAKRRERDSYFTDYKNPSSPVSAPTSTSRQSQSGEMQGSPRRGDTGGVEDVPVGAGSGERPTS